MPDLTIVPMKQCKSLSRRTVNVKHYIVTTGDEQHAPECTCPAYKFSKSANKRCKHIAQVEDAACGWHEQWGEELYSPVDGTCPRCGGDVETVMVGV